MKHDFCFSKYSTIKLGTASAMVESWDDLHVFLVLIEQQLIWRGRSYVQNDTITVTRREMNHMWRAQKHGVVFQLRLVGE